MEQSEIQALADAVIAAGDNNAASWEQIKNYVFQRTTNVDNPPIPWQPPIADINGLGELIYDALVANGNTAAIGGIAPILEQIGNIVLTYPYTRSPDGFLATPN